MLNIVAIGWMYVILMMSITERSVTAGLMTFVFYGVLPVSVILYLMSTPRRRQRRLTQEKAEQEAARQAADKEASTEVSEGAEDSATSRSPDAEDNQAGSRQDLN